MRAGPYPRVRAPTQVEGLSAESVLLAWLGGDRRRAVSSCRYIPGLLSFNPHTGPLLSYFLPDLFSRGVNCEEGCPTLHPGPHTYC